VRRLALIAVLGALLVGCGGEDDVTATPETVEGSVSTQTETGETTTTGTTTETTGTGTTAAEGDAAAGKAVYDQNGCGGCHVFGPAGSDGSTGPNLDNLPQFAETAGEDLPDFTRDSIEKPNDYVEEGFPEGVMPAYDQLEDKQLDDLVAFLTTS
jgi:mono/diheme cytochrome c family protein